MAATPKETELLAGMNAKLDELRACPGTPTKLTPQERFDALEQELAGVRAALSKERTERANMHRRAQKAEGRLYKLNRKAASEEMHATVRCTCCGAIGPDQRDSTWRYAAPGWQHKCPGSGQAGHMDAEAIKPPPVREILELWMEAVSQGARGINDDGDICHDFMSAWEDAFQRLLTLGLAEKTGHACIRLLWSGLDQYGPAPVTQRGKERGRGEA